MRINPILSVAKSKVTVFRIGFIALTLFLFFCTAGSALAAASATEMPDSVRPITAKPQFSVVSGTYSADQIVSIKSITTGAVVYFTLDGKTPSTSSAKYSKPIKVASSESIYAFAVAPKQDPSAIVFAKYTVQLPAARPQFSLKAGTYTSDQTVTISDSTPDAAIYYTTDSSAPAASWSHYVHPLIVSASETLNAVARAKDLSGSAILTSTFTMIKPTAKPVFSLVPGTYTSNQSVTITSTTAGAEIHYTTDGSKPSSASAIYLAGVIVSGTETLQAIATAPSSSASVIASATYKIALAPGNTPTQSVFLPPAQNACQSDYDRFYEAESGVYAYWALCEPGAAAQIYDYVGQFDLTSAASAWGNGFVGGVTPGPVNDSETAVSVPTASYAIENQGIPLNSNGGTLSGWVKADATNYPVTAAYLGAVSLKSQVSIGVSIASGLCFNGNFTNSAGTVSTIQKCGFGANTWHRVSLSWAAGRLSLYVDGDLASSGIYVGSLDDALFYYRLFPGCCDTGKSMSLAKVSVSNQAWSAAQVAADFAPVLAPVPVAGVYVSGERLGEIHRDVLGYGDMNQNIATPAVRTALLAGLKKAGVAAVRYGNGYGGFNADLENWQGGVVCTHVPGTTGPARNVATGDSLDNFMPQVAEPLGLDVTFTVNYSTNAPFCDAGGDPIVNGADLVQYANLSKNYGIKHWEIGNELFSTSSETDFHPNPNTGASYVQYEPAFYNAMKAKDPSIKIAVPVGLAIYSWQTLFDFPVLAGASYDAVVWHNYPMRDPITDGATLYQDRVASEIERTHGALLKLQTELLNYGKSPDAIWITEWNGEVAGNKWSKQTMGAVTPMFVATQLAEYMQAGVQGGHMVGAGAAQRLFHTQLRWPGRNCLQLVGVRCNRPGLCSPTPGHGEVNVGLQPGDLTPAGRAFRSCRKAVSSPRASICSAPRTDQVNAPWLESYAATHGSSYAVLLINRDRDLAHTVPVAIDGLPAGGGRHTVVVWKNSV